MTTKYATVIDFIQIKRRRENAPREIQPRKDVMSNPADRMKRITDQLEKINSLLQTMPKIGSGKGRIKIEKS